MPFEDPEPDDPQMLVGVFMPADEAATRDMATAIADEFAQLGLDRQGILTLFRNPFYAGAYGALTRLGEEEVSRIIDESLEVWGRFRCTVREGRTREPRQTRLVGPNGRLKLIG